MTQKSSLLRLLPHALCVISLSCWRFLPARGTLDAVQFFLSVAILITEVLLGQSLDTLFDASTANLEKKNDYR